MPRKIEWSPKAVHEWAKTLKYWIKRNKSNEYSLKLDRLFVEKFDIIINAPDTGRKTDFTMVRIKIIRHNKVYYRIYPEKIEIIAIWDTRRNPKRFKL
jgi:plasmid stabilization system protein ParE